ncbi:hypothetical protein [Oligoflexus tunisiensis]|uniref:hypothetical protein n=1 Tax=Oligoflexus tunisiensis TaxID=708132 RepID=UPI00114CE8BF|nr:hypothetical protein [Oligoflexus tunisiensis]
MRRWGKILAVVLLVLGGLEIAWIIAANRYLENQEFKDLLQKGGTRFAYEKASSYLPGHIHVKGLTFEDERTRMELPEARLQISLLALAGKRIIIWSANGRGGSLAFQPGEPSAEGDAGADRGTPPPTSDTEDRSWPVYFQELTFRNLQSLKVGAFAAQGSIDVSAELQIAAEDKVRIRDGTLELRQVQTHWKEQKLAHIEKLEGRFELDPFRAKDELLRKLSLDLRGQAELEQGEVLQSFIVDAPWLRIKGLNLQSSGRIVLNQGQLGPATELVFESPHMETELWKETVRGLGKLTLAVDDRVQLELSIPAFSIDHEANGHRDVSGRDLNLKLVADDRDVLSRDRAWHAALVLPESTVHDLRYFNHFLPKGLGFEFRSGEGKVALHLDSANTQGNFIRVDAPAALVSYENRDFYGSIHQELNIATIDFVQEGFTVPTGLLKLNVRPGGKDSQEEPWVGQLQLQQGRVQVTPSRFEGTFQLHAADLRPILWIFDPKSKLPDWSRKLFRDDKLEAQFHLKADESSYAIDHFKAETSDLKLEAWYQGTPEHKRGKLFLRYGSLTAGIGVQDDDYKLQLLSSREWFQNRQ